MRRDLAAALALSLLVLAGCDLSMRRQARYDTEASAKLWPNSSSARRLPAGTVRFGAGPQTSSPPQVTPSLITRGAQRFEIFCTPCHGRAGRGDGTVVARGFPAPPDFHSPAIEAASDQHLYDVITNGWGVMYDFGSRIAPSDRWAIIAYVRTLQSGPEAPSRIAERPQATAVLPQEAVASPLEQGRASR
ncbi:MAG: c-type cytochrome [Caulobacteraceae bacterium]